MDDFRRDDKNRRGAEPAKSMAAIRMVVWATIGLVFLTTAAVAQIERKPIAPEDLQKIQDSNAKCLECHSEASFDALDRPNVDKEKLRAHLVDPSVYEDSNHGRVECLACHVKGFKETPHVEKDKQQINWCDECHTRKFLRIEMQFDESVHAKDGIKDKFTCSTCHDPHGVSSTQVSGASGTHLINFDRDIVGPSKTTRRGPTFVDKGTFRGTCTLNCHGEEHVNRTYPN